MNIIERYKLKNNIKDLSINKKLTDQQLIFLNDNLNLIDKFNINRVLELYDLIGEKNTLCALNDNIIFDDPKEIMDYIIKEHYNDFEILKNNFFENNYNSIYNLIYSSKSNSNFNLLKDYQKKGIINFEDFRKYSDLQIEDIPLIFVSDLLKKYIKVQKDNKDIIKYVHELENLEKNNVIDLNSFVYLNSLGFNLSSDKVDIYYFDEKIDKSSIELAIFLVENNLLKKLNYDFRFNDNPYEYLLNFIKNYSIIEHKYGIETLNIEDIDKIYNYLSNKFNIITSRDILIKENGKYVLKNNSDILKEEGIYDIISKELLDVLNIDVNTILKLSNYIPYNNIKNNMADILKIYAGYKENSFYTDFDNNMDIITLINSDPFDINKINIFLGNICDNYWANTRINWEKKLIENGIEDISFLDGFDYFKKIPFEQSDNFILKIKNMLNLYNKSLKKLENIYYLDENMYKSCFLSLLISLDYFEVYNKNEINEEIIIDFFVNNLKEADRMNSFYKIFSNITYKHNPQLLKYLFDNYKEMSSKKYSEILQNLLKKPNIYNFDDIDNYELGDINKLLIPILDDFKEYCISKEQVQQLQNAFEVALLQKNSKLPYFNYEEDEKYSYSMYKFWDPRLLRTDIENGYSVIGLDELCEVIKDPSKRIIEVSSKTTNQKRYLILNRTDKNDLYVNVIPLGYNDEFDIVVKNIIHKYESYLKDKDKFNRIFINNELYIDNHTDKQTIVEYYEEPSHYTNAFISGRELKDTREDEKKMFNIIKHAFERDGVGISEDESLSFIVGRDWALRYYSSLLFKNNYDYLSLRVVGRFNEQSNNKLGSYELKQEIYKLCKKHKKVSCTAHATSYYMIAKWASEGKIFIYSDIQGIDDGINSLAHDSFRENGVYYKSDIGFSPNFSTSVCRKKANFNNSSVACLDFKTVINSNGESTLTDEEKEQLEVQKRIYTDVIRYLDKSWEEQKRLISEQDPESIKR